MNRHRVLNYSPLSNKMVASGAPALARRLLRIALAGVIVSSAACNRVEPEKTSAGKEATEQPAQPSSAPQLLAADDARSAQPSASSPNSQPILPPTTQPFTSTRGPDASASVAGSQAGNAAPASAVPGDTSAGDASGGAGQASGPGVHIEMTTPSLPVAGADTSSQALNDTISQRIPDRDFVKLAMTESNRPEDLLLFFGKCDKAIQELTITAHTQQMGETEFHEHAKRISQMKLDAAERMLGLSGLTSEQQKSATAARVESLSHLTSLGDIPAAQKLQTLAQQLSQSDDHELAHQGKLVLLGFRLNQLQEGQLKDPQLLLGDMAGLLETPEDRGLVELMALQRCADVLSQLGYSDQSKQVLDLVVQEYRNSPDPELSMRAWTLETNGAPATVAFNEAVQATLAGTEKDAQQVARTSAELLATFPSVNTLWHVTRLLIPLEFSGNVPAAKEVAQVAEDARKRLPTGPLSAEIDTFLDCHARRLAILGKPLELTELAMIDGRPFDWASYRGKVVLVCFWASWELNSLREIEALTLLRQQVTSKDFEIVTINLDDATANSAKQVIAQTSYPWASLRSSNPNAVGFATPIAKELGVNAVPFVMLVDRSGKVVAIHARGEKAATMINELLSAK